MASFLSNLSPNLLQNKTSEKFNRSFFHKDSTYPLSTFYSSSSAFFLPSLLLTKVENIPQVLITDSTSRTSNDDNEKNDFYVNVGSAVRTLREDLPLLFSKDLNYDIYRDDITFMDPLNTFCGIENYKLIFWALRFHGRMLFKDISLEIYRVWQPSENVILIRWNLKGTPRVPWETQGEFQGTSRYKLDRKGKIYEHKVDNLAFNFPHKLKPSVSVLGSFVTDCPTSPNLTFLFGTSEMYPSSWVSLYRSVKETVNYGADCTLENEKYCIVL